MLFGQGVLAYSDRPIKKLRVVRPLSCSSTCELTSLDVGASLLLLSRSFWEAFRIGYFEVVIAAVDLRCPYSSILLRRPSFLCHNSGKFRGDAVVTGL